MSSTLTQTGGTYCTRDQLRSLPCPEGTRSWRPIPHHDLVTSLADDFDRRGIQVVREQYATVGRNAARLFGVMDLRVAGFDTPEIGTSLGLRAANDKSMAIQVVAAARVFVCSNMCFSGSDGAVVLKKKHTSGLDLAAVVRPAIESYLEKAGAFRRDIDRMRDFTLTDSHAKEMIYDGFLGRDPILPVRLLPDVHRLYFDDDEQRAKFTDRSIWSLDNAFTESIKQLQPVPQQRYGIRIGRYFSQALNETARTQVSLTMQPDSIIMPGEGDLVD